MSWWHWAHRVRANVAFAVRWIYWPGMTRGVKFQIVRCDQCIQFKSKPQNAAMENIWATHPLQLVYLDNIIIEVTEGGKDVHGLIITDHFTRQTQALVTSSRTDKGTAQDLWHCFVVHYGLPKSIVSDQGQNFRSNLISELCKLAKVWKLCTSPYHLQTGNVNGPIIH